MLDGTVGLAQLVNVRSRLVEEILAYLDALGRQTAELPAYYPDHLHSDGRDDDGRTGFDDIRQLVQVIEDRSELEQWLAEEQERQRAMGQDIAQRIYKPRAARPEDEDPGQKPQSPPVPWDEVAGARFPRAVILGDPGFGKSWLLRYEARRLALAAFRQLDSHQIGRDEMVLPLFIRLPDLARSQHELLEEAILAHVTVRRTATFLDFVWQKLATDKCVLLLDALDEVPPKQRSFLVACLAAFARDVAAPRLLLTSRIVGYGGAPVPEAKELELLAFDRPQIEAFVRTWFKDERSAQFLAMLQHNHAVRGLARIPLMLALMCRAYTDKKGSLAFPTRRTDLYERCLRGLLLDWRQEDKRDWETTPAFVEAMLELLSAVGYNLFAEGYEQFDESKLRAQMILFLQTLAPWHELYGQSPATLIADLKHAGILIRAGEHRHAPLLFLHRTFHEYLTAQALAMQANRAGWDEIAELVDKKAWRPEWQQVIILLAGQLENPTPLLAMLAAPEPTPTNPTGDDYYRHRLALAALCLPETTSTWRNEQAELAMIITTDTFSLWWQMQQQGIIEIASPLRVVLPALAQCNSLMRSDQFPGSDNGSKIIPFLTCVVRLLQDEKKAVRRKAVLAVAVLGSAVAKSTFLDQLAHLLQDKDEGVRRTAVWAVWSLGGAASTPAFLGHLARLLRHIDGVVRGVAAEAVGRLGSAAATPTVLDHLALLLQDEDWWVRRAAAEAVGRMGNVVVTPDILSHLALLLQDKDGEVRQAAAEAMGILGSVVVTSDILDRLALLLQDEDLWVRQAAAEALGKLDSATATPAFLDHLVRLLRDEDWRHGRRAEERSFLLAALKRTVNDATVPPSFTRLRHLFPLKVWRVRKAAAEAVGRLGNAAAPSAFLDHLGLLLQDEDRAVRRAAAEAVGRLGSAAATPPFLDHLAHRLKDVNWEIRETAAEAVGRLGSTAITPVIVDHLADLLQDKCERVQWSAVEAVGRLGNTTVIPAIVDHLARLLQDEDARVRETAAKAMGRLGSAAVTPTFLDHLARLLQDEEWEVRRAAAAAVGRLDSVTATSAILDNLARLLRDQEKRVRMAAAVTVGRLGRAAATPAILDRLAHLLEDRDREVLQAALGAVGNLGSAAATPRILDCLAHLLQNEDEEVRQAAATAVGNLSSAAATPRILDCLAHLLQNEDSRVRGAVVNAVGKFIAQGLRLFTGTDSTWEAFHVDELSQ